ncbi:MAG: N-acetylglutaminylglutamine amidotransferase [Alphaproteobacteria bacterium]|nr:N-acetylglutaminylglutamine amidotransferase [Alphaproteobacteria bacterium]
MCGICGELSFGDRPASARSVTAMADIMAPRGPDAEGLVVHGPVALGHRRLKIIDLTDRARQPMTDAELGLTLVFNGCIYNHGELRGELEAMGYRFFSDGDTEVVLKAWHAWGASCARRFNGMFAFAVHERDTGRLALGRDRLGIKPLYIDHDPVAGRVRFASTLPALLAAGATDTAIDPVALHHYMSFHAVVPAPLTLLRGPRKVSPATIVTFEPDGRRTDQQYCELRFDQDPEDRRRSAEEWEDRVHAALSRAVARRMTADVPVGVLLSGGVDSSLVVGLLAELGQEGLKTFSIGFDAVGEEEGNEFRYSDLVAERFGTEHHRIIVKPPRLIDALPRAIAAMSEPMVSHDAVAFYLLSEEVSQHVKVVQSGQGADEIFGGYHWYPPLMETSDAVRDYAAVFFDRDHEEYGEAVDDALVDMDFSRAFVAGHFDRPGAERPIDKALRLDTGVMLVDDPVKRVDNMTMAFGLEARVPFLDHELVELAGRIPAEHKLKGEGKGVLKDVARRIIPPEVIDRPKGYFPVPALKYLEGPYYEMVVDVLSSARARERGLFKPAYVDKLLSDPRAHMTPLRGSKLWQVALLEFWLQAHGL